MKTEIINLNELYNVKGGVLRSLCDDMSECGYLSPFIRPAIIIVPGGGYNHVSPREGNPVALKYLSEGFQTFVFEYLTEPDGVKYPEQLLELAAAVDYIKKNAEKYSVNKEEIFACGFSAGGHLVANLCVSDKTELYYGSYLDCSLRAAVLSYPVISNDFNSSGSFSCLLPQINDLLLSEVNVDRLVNENTCPAFIWTTAEDKSVDPVSSLKYAEALSRHGVTFELHVYPKGGHGSSVCSHELNSCLTGLETNRVWLSDSIRFLRMFVSEQF